MKNYINQNKERFFEELFTFLRIPSVSADSTKKPDVRKAAEHLQQLLVDAGVDKAEVMETGGHPVVYAEKIVDPSLKTILIYGHYDVQPAEMADGWTSDPFEPFIQEDEKFFGRGTADDKGQLFMHVKVLEFFNKENSFPCNVKYLFEGEEEIGSQNLDKFIENNQELLKADLALISDTAMVAPGVPSITTGLRGLVYMEVELVGPDKDVHSGVYGGLIENPINALCHLLASVKNADGQIQVEGFYDNVVPLSAEERELLAKTAEHAINPKEIEQQIAVSEFAVEKDYTPYESSTARPTFDICGIVGGYTGEGAKTIIPTSAKAKISFRLVANQDPARISELVQKHLEQQVAPGVNITVTPMDGGFASLTPIDSPAFQAADKALQQTFGKPALPARCGGSIPVTATFEKVLGIETLLLGFGLDEDNIHSPNETFRVENFLKGMETLELFLREWGKE